MHRPSARRVLVVDDQRDCREAFQCLLESWGYTTVAVASRDDALSAMAERLPDALVADLGLPTVADGIAVIRAARRMRDGDSVLILGLSGHGRDIDRRAAIAAGCDFFFVKPPDLDRVFQALGTVESRRGRTHADRETPAS